MRKTFIIITLLILSVSATVCRAIPSVSIVFDAKSSDDVEATEVTTVTGSAPIEATFKMIIDDADDWTYTYEWHFCHTGGNLDEPYMVRYEESPEVTFTQAGTDSIALYITFTRGTETIEYTRDYWSETQPLTVLSSESKLTMPNAFSPNGDGINDTYKPIDYQSIIEFKATIYNRWGQKIYDWDDVRSDGWNGTFHGSDVKDGVYFVVVKALGADGRRFEIKKDVNLLRKFTEYSDTSN